MKRHHFFFFGWVFLFLGIQFRLIETYVLNPEATRVVEQRLGAPSQRPALAILGSVMGQSRYATRTVTPPQWVGWALISLGTVLILHSLAIPKD